MAADGVLLAGMRHIHAALLYSQQDLTYLTEEWLGRWVAQDVQAVGATVPWMGRWNELADDVDGDEDGMEELGTDRRELYRGAGLPSF